MEGRKILKTATFLAIAELVQTNRQKLIPLFKMEKLNL